MSEPVFLMVGKLRRPFGVKGEMVLDIYSSENAHFKPGRTLLVGEEHQPYVIAAIRRHMPNFLVVFDGIDNREDAARLTNQDVFIPSHLLPPLKAGEYYLYQLIGLMVLDEDGVEIGSVTEVIETGANDVLVIKTAAGGELLVPDIPEVVKKVDVPAGTITIRPQTWS